MVTAATPIPTTSTSMPDDPHGKMATIHPVEKLWREVGLPEYFLGNGGSNTKLYALYDAIIEKCAKIADCGCLVPPDGGSPTEAEREMCDGIASAIRLQKLETCTREDMTLDRG